MKRAFPIILIAFTTLFLGTGVPTAGIAQQYEPSVGQEGKDVIWVPTPEDLIQAMLDAAKVTPNDFVMDLGSGDGRIVIAAAKRELALSESSTIPTWSNCQSGTQRRLGFPTEQPF